MKVSSFESLKRGTESLASPLRRDPDIQLQAAHAANLSSQRALINDPSQTGIQSINESTNEQIKQFLKNDPSATHLGDIGTIFGGGQESQIGQSMQKLTSHPRLKNNDSSTMASSYLKKNHSKLNTVVDRYLVNKPSSIDLRLNSKRHHYSEDESVLEAKASRHLNFQTIQATGASARQE